MQFVIFKPSKVLWNYYWYLIYSTMIRILLLCLVDTEESFRNDNAKLNFLGVIWESKRSWRVHFQPFREPKIQNFGNHGATSGIYWVYYKPPILSNWEFASTIIIFSFNSLILKMWYPLIALFFKVSFRVATQFP